MWVEICSLTQCSLCLDQPRSSPRKVPSHNVIFSVYAQRTTGIQSVETMGSLISLHAMLAADHPMELETQQ